MKLMYKKIIYSILNEITFDTNYNIQSIKERDFKYNGFPIY